MEHASRTNTYKPASNSLVVHIHTRRHSRHVLQLKRQLPQRPPSFLVPHPVKLLQILLRLVLLRMRASLGPLLLPPHSHSQEVKLHLAVFELEVQGRRGMMMMTTTMAVDSAWSLEKTPSRLIRSVNVRHFLHATDTLPSQARRITLQSAWRSAHS